VETSSTLGTIQREVHSSGPAPVLSMPIYFRMI